MHARRRRALTYTVVAFAVAVVVSGFAPASSVASQARGVPERTALEVAEAHVVRARSRVGINYGQRRKRFFGRVRSRARICRGSRIVRLIKVRHGISDVLVASARSGALGRWRIRRPQAHGRFYVKVIRKVRTPYGHFHRCRADTSRVIRVR